MLLKERCVKINFSKEKLIKSSKNLELENSSLVMNLYNLEKNLNFKNLILKNKLEGVNKLMKT